jgi:hypothetical protein
MSDIDGWGSSWIGFQFLLTLSDFPLFCQKQSSLFLSFEEACGKTEEKKFILIYQCLMLQIVNNVLYSFVL